LLRVHARIRVVLQGSPITESAQTAVLQWKFKPAMLDGEPVDSVTPVAVYFVREGSPPRFGAKSAANR
jgi:hypothetical protein